jgi:5-methylcytosine-specific restriction endonuclease McrA
VAANSDNELEAVPRIMYLTDDHRGNIGIKSKGRCWYCGADFSRLKRTLDHVVPRSRGGSNHPSNLVFACQSCNSEKGSRSLEDYRHRVIQRRGPVIFYGETITTLGDSHTKPKQPLRIIQTLEEAVEFARERQ